MLIDFPRTARAQVLGGPLEKPEPLELGDYLWILRERWFAVAVSVLAMLIIAGGYTLVATPSYSATATLFVTAASSDDTAYANSQFARQRVTSYPDIVDSPEVLNKVLNEVPLEMSVAELAGHVKAVNPTDTVLLEVSADAPDAVQAAQIANAAAEGLGDAVEKLETAPQTGGMKVKAALMVPATAPGSPDEPRPLINLALAVILGLSIGVVAALLLDRSERRIRWVRDIERDFGQVVIGEVVSSGIHDGGLDASSRAAYRELAANLQLINDGEVPRRTLLVSVGEDQQRSGGAALGQVLAGLGRRVCVVDGDATVDPVLAGRPRIPGAGEILMGQVELHEAVQGLDAVPMDYLPAGSLDPSLRRHDIALKIHPLLEALEENHDTLVLSTRFDAAPIDAALLAPMADSVLLVCGVRETLRVELAAALKELTAAHVIPTGVVLVHPVKRRAGRRQRG